MLVLNDEVTRELLAHAKSEYPNECCGVLLGKQISNKRFAEQALRLENKSARDKSAYFALDPLVIHKTELLAFAHDLMIVGFYHSHPNCAAVLSKTDERYMLYDHSYPIVSVNEGADGLYFKIASFEKIIGTNICREEYLITESEKNYEEHVVHFGDSAHFRRA